MKKNGSIKQALALASCTLLGVNHAADINDPEESADIGNWDIKTSMLVYAEADNRVTAVEPVIQARKQIDTEESLTLKLALDGLTGASPTGAVPTDSIQTYTSASGNNPYQTPAGSLPLDEEFRDTRVALNASWVKPLGPNYKMVLGANASSEYDYLSLAANASISRDFNRRNTTLSAGFSYAFDEIEPVGGVPVILTSAVVNSIAGPTEDRDTLDILLGVTQVIDKSSLFQLNYSYSQSDGYHSDPYKVLSVVTADGRPVVLDATTGQSLVLFESRPTERNKHSVYGGYKRYLSGDVLTTALRYATDDWEVDSVTADLRYRWRLSSQSYLQPRLRVYQQTEAEFYRPFLRDNVAVPEFASADLRLADFTAYTFGFNYGRDNSSKPWSIGLEYYLQSGDEPQGKIGELLNQELFPDLKAIMLRFNYDF